MTRHLPATLSQGSSGSLSGLGAGPAVPEHPPQLHSCPGTQTQLAAGFQLQ